VILDIRGALINNLKRISVDFEFFDYHRFNCSTYIMYSPSLNQIIAIKFPTREHYIPPSLAQKYLQRTRECIENKVGNGCKKAYTLNILISDRLTKSCFDLISTKSMQKNMDMLFNPRKTKDKEILATIFKALFTKFKKWSDEVRNGCKKSDKKRPYGAILDKINELERVAYRFESKHYENKKGGK